MLVGLLLLAAFPSPFAAKLIPGLPVPAGTRPPLQVVPDAAPRAGEAAEAGPTQDTWSEAEVTAAREQCTQMLSGVAASYEMLDPVRKGACGSPAPVLLKSVGSEPAVVFDPPVEVNCRMVAALDSWVKSTLQPRARAQFRSPVVRIAGGSGYACRNIYNLPNARLSQHALANAVDIGGFSFESGREIWVSRGWGMTGRDIKVAKAKAETEAKAKATAKAKADGEADVASAKDDDADGTVTEVSHTDVSKRPVAQASLTPPLATLPLRAKKPAPAAAGSFIAPKPTKEALFLRAVHGGACTGFGTVLGPEANDPHRSHFHLDLIPRVSRGYCR